MFSFKNLHKEQVENMFKMAAIGTTGHLIIVLLTFYIFYDIVNINIFYFFFTMFIIGAIYRYIIIWKYYKSKKEYKLSKWIILYTIGIVFTSFLWGIGAIYITLTGIPIEYEFLLFSIIIGIGAAGIATFGIVFYSYAIYVIVLFVPYNFFLFYEADKFHIISGILLSIAIPYFLKAAFSYCNSFRTLIEKNEYIIIKEKKFSDAILDTVIKVLEEKDPYTVGHAARVRDMSVNLGKLLSLSDYDLEILKKSSYLHDIGKLAIPDDILKKPGVLTEKEYEMIKSHPQKGYDILSIAEDEQINGYLPVIRHHHERYDGLGYPDGLSKNDIPFFARIVSIVDTFDAMTSTRSYRKALPVNTALNELERGKGRQFDPEICDIFLKMVIKEKDEQYKVSKFIKELETEHDTILDLFETVRENYSDKKLAYKLLFNIKEQLVKHLEKENKYIYPLLQKEAEKEIEFKKSLEMFLKNTDNLPDAFEETLKIFSDDNKNSDYYKKSLDKLAIKLYERIKKEEGIVFREFEERVHQAPF